VLGLDIDPDAIAAARRNAAVNDCADGLDLLLAGPELLHERPPFPLVLANLLAHTHLALAPRYRRLVAPGGQLILGGILEHEDAEVVEGLAGAGFALEEKLVIEGWSGLRLRAVPA
jgi:ribosomal protein L11 methyltransferase